MNFSASQKLQPDDPRVTAYALGELEGEERARVAAAVAADPALQAMVEEINGTVAQLTAALATEPAPDVAPIEIELPAAPPLRRQPRPTPLTSRGRMFQFPYVLVGSLAAACFAVAFLIINQNQPVQTKQAARAFAPVELANDKPTTVQLIPPATEAPRSPLPLPTPITGGAPALAAAPTPPAPVTTTDVPIVVAPVLTESPNSTTVAVRQTQASSPVASAGLAHSERPRNDSPMASLPPLPRPELPGTTRNFVAQAPMPPNAAQPSLPTNATSIEGYFAEITGTTPSDSDHLRLTFREFGAPRYAATPSARAGAESVGLAANPNGAGPDVAHATPPAESRQRTSDNVKTTAPTTPRIPYEAPTAGVVLRDEVNFRGTLNRESAGMVADLESSLRDPNGAVDSPVIDFVRDNAFVPAAENRASVFPVIVDSASHINVRRALLAGSRPARETVRIEELLNHPGYDYAAPVDAATPFNIALEVASAPWAPGHRLVRVGLKARDVAPADRPRAHYVVLVETGAAGDSRLPLIKDSLRQFVDRLAPQDELAVVLHSTTASLVLPSTAVRERESILDAIDQLRTSGAAEGATGLQLAYDVARSHFIAGGINRVILASDGDTRIGATRRDAAIRLIDEQASVGIALSALGFGVQDIRDSMLEQIAHRGTGEIAFIDTPRDAWRALADRAGGGFTPIARRVKLQVEFNPTRVQSWRLIGYEDRVFLREDFDHENLAAEIVGAGHALTALFEIVPVAASAPVENHPVEAEMLSVKVRYAFPTDDTPRVQQAALTDTAREFVTASSDFKFAAAIAGFGMLLRDSPHRGSATFADVALWARAGLGSDRDGFRAEFVELVERAGRVMQ